MSEENTEVLPGDNPECMADGGPSSAAAPQETAAEHGVTEPAAAADKTVPPKEANEAPEHHDTSSQQAAPQPGLTAEPDPTPAAEEQAAKPAAAQEAEAKATAAATPVVDAPQLSEEHEATAEKLAADSSSGPPATATAEMESKPHAAEAAAKPHNKPADAAATRHHAAPAAQAPHADSSNAAETETPRDKQHKPHKAPGPHHKETAAERLTTPTAMRMLKQLEQTQGGKQEWHIATGVPFQSKKLSADEMSAMVDRLCTPKKESDNLPTKPHAVKLAFEGSKEVLVPVKESTKDENIEYMSNLYTRCQETRAKTMQTLQDKWLQPLIKPRAAAK